MEQCPPLALVMGPAGSGKTEWALHRFAQAGGRALLVVPSSAQADTQAARIATMTGREAADIRPAIFTFRSLAYELFRPAEPAGSREIGRAFQRLVVADLVRVHLQPGDYFGPMRTAPGFAPALVERIREWKLACVTPDELEAAAPIAADALGDPVFARKAAEMARLFRAYETFLAHNRMRDEEDALRLAADQVTRGTHPLPQNANLILVDGFYRFNRAQIRLLGALAARGLHAGAWEAEVGITLPYDGSRPLLFAAPARAVESLCAEFACQEIELPARSPDPPTALHALEAGIYREEGVRRWALGVKCLTRATHEEEGTETREQNNTQRPTPNAQRPTLIPVLLFDAPNPYVEAEMVARAFRRRYDEGGCTWSDFVVILRTLGDYAPILAAVFERYGVPLGVDGPERLAENPLVKTLLLILAVVRRGWQRDDVLALLKSSYTAPDKLAADALRHRARAARVRAGRDVWLTLVADDTTVIGETLRAMARREDALTAEGVTPHEMVDTVRDLVTGFGLDERIADGEPARQERDRAALQGAMDVLAGLGDLFALAERDTVRSRKELFSFQAFHTELESAWQSASSMAAPTGEIVHVAEPYDTRDRPVKIAAVMGLTERVFPRRVSEDPFLRDEEREALRSEAGITLDLQRQRTDDERFLFYLAVTAPSERLILSYPRASTDSDNLPSFYLDEVRAALESDQLQTVSRTLADVAPRREETVSHGDRLLAACADLFDPNLLDSSRTDSNRGVLAPEALADAERRLRDCVDSAPRPDRVRRVIASRVRPTLPRLQALELRAEFAGHKAVYSVSELETYGRCPFRYLLAHVLAVTPETDGAEARIQGTLLHDVLRRCLRRRRSRAAREPAPATPEMDLRADLRRHLEAALERQPMDISTHRLRMTQRLLFDAIDGFAEREERFTTQFGLIPSHFELSFGLDPGASQVWEEERDGPMSLAAHDPASCAEPLRLMADDGGPEVAVCGTIDRVDLDASGQRALVMDYKLGRPPEWAEIQRGVSLQMPLYLLALERLFGKLSAVACYDSVRERGRRRFHRMEHVSPRQFGPILPIEDGRSVTPLNRDQYQDLIRTAEGTAIRLARGISTARIEATPGEHCRTCAYGDVCRTTLAGHDGERPGPQSSADENRTDS